ncbi:MAG: ferrous iron transport protein B, partial [Cytophagaceae bacterium]|nr:ferrous iron transport protein B [Cytophagaceae bacterium]MDW8457402.1 ferrous iron transport protein B [Cytophagaceae bacterium]
MAKKQVLKIALLGNPNSGKSSLFNHLTGLNQKVGNFPGVTVDKKTGLCKIDRHIVAEIIDLPGTYSLYPKSLDEHIVFDFLNSPNDELYPDYLVVVADASNLKRNLLLFTQVRDLGFPVILALNMLDVARRNGINIDLQKLQQLLGVPVVGINARTGKGIDLLKAAIACPVYTAPDAYLNYDEFCMPALEQIKSLTGHKNNYIALQIAHRYNDLKSLSPAEKKKIASILQSNGFDSTLLQSKEIIHRYEAIHNILQKCLQQEASQNTQQLSLKIDNILTHKVWGYLIFFLLLFLMFQAIYEWASIPMDYIDAGVNQVNEWLRLHLPKGALTELITEGVISGLGGILMFIPQIAILFFFISILEESGYMTRVMYLMDKLMRPFGLNGRSIVPLISGVACAVPAIMSTRSIDSVRERLVTILVTPLISCSARIPVFTVLIALVIPQKYLFGVFNLQGLVLLLLYLSGFWAALVSAYVFSKIMPIKEKSFFIMEFPLYRMPRWKNVFITIVEKIKTFTLQAGQVILAISIVLWVLASYGPKDAMQRAEAEAVQTARRQNMDSLAIEKYVEAKKIENSYAGQFGKFIEPVIKPIGFDWKIGIALLTSFAAREVFVGTMSTIYSVADESDSKEPLLMKMKQEINPDTGEPVYNLATGV